MHSYARNLLVRIGILIVATHAYYTQHGHASRTKWRISAPRYYTDRTRRSPGSSLFIATPRTLYCTPNARISLIGSMYVTSNESPAHIRVIE